MKYTLKITTTDDGTVAAQVTGTTQHGTVLEIDHWTAATLDQAITAAAIHGWNLVRKLRTGTTQTTVQPSDMRAHATHVAQRRRDSRAVADQWNEAFNDLVATTPPPGDPLYLSAIDLAEISGLKRQRIHAIRREYGATPGTNK